MKNPSWLIAPSKVNFSKPFGYYISWEKFMCSIVYVGIGQDSISFVIFEEL